MLYGTELAHRPTKLKDSQAYGLAKEFHWGCRRLKVAYFLQDQLMRASSSVVLNLAEGSGKRTPTEQRRFYGIALGSLRECQAIIELEKIEHPELTKIADRLGAIIFALTHPGRPRAENGNRPQTETETEPKP